MIKGTRVKTFNADAKGSIQLIRDVPGDEVFKDYPKTFHVRPSHHSRPRYKLTTTPPYRDFHHFKEHFKPWVSQQSYKKDHGPHELWYEVLEDINKRYGFGIDVKNIGFKKPNLGLFPTFNMVEDMKKLQEKASSKKL